MGQRGPKPKPEWQRQGHRRRAEHRAGLDQIQESEIPPDEIEDEPDTSPTAELLRRFRTR